jgi:branched-chain amino acid transport system permease protein
VSILAIGVFFAFLHRSKLGTWMRAVRFDPETATAMGIPARRIYLITFAIGFAMAALGGVVAAPITTVYFEAGVDVLPFCFMAVIIGGLGNLGGTVAAAVLLAFVEGIITSFTDPTFARIGSLCLMSVVLMVRPHGIFAGATR